MPRYFLTFDETPSTERLHSGSLAAIMLGTEWKEREMAPVSMRLKTLHRWAKHTFVHRSNPRNSVIASSAKGPSTSLELPLLASVGGRWHFHGGRHEKQPNDRGMAVRVEQKGTERSTNGALMQFGFRRSRNLARLPRAETSAQTRGKQ